MTAREIQRRLIYEHYRESFVLHNYTPKDWFECDIFQVTGALFFVEYEIKISRADFKNDAKKARSDYKWNGGNFERCKTQTKHELIKTAKPPAPSRFYYVMPSGLYSPAETPIPEWAGLIVVHPAERAGSKLGVNHPYYMRTVVEKKAPQLHREKIDPAIVTHARGVCYWRMHNMIVRDKEAFASA